MMITSERPNRLSGSRRLNGMSVDPEHVALAAHGLQIAREFRVRLDLTPKPGDLHVHGSEADAAVAVGQVLAAEDLARAAGEGLQQAGLGLGQPERRLALHELAPLRVEAIGAEAQLGRRRRRPGAA